MVSRARSSEFYDRCTVFVTGKRRATLGGREALFETSQRYVRIFSFTEGLSEIAHIIIYKRLVLIFTCDVYVCIVTHIYTEMSYLSYI